MAKFFSVAAGLLVVASLSSTAGAVSAANDQPASVVGPQAVTYQPPAGLIDRIDGLRITITQVNYPGVPERSACRFLVRASNDGKRTVSAHAMLRTFDSYKAALNVWLVPTGDLAPGQSVQRIYSCKLAQSMVLDQGSASGWPGRCSIDGTEYSPCPASLQLEANIPILTADPSIVEVKAK